MCLNKVSSWIVILCLWSSYISAQVPNDLIENRIELLLNKSFHSNTVDCKVEKNCIDEALTGKCIKYHNDQWFTFKPESDQPLYINISEQSCRDLKGVQIVVIDGEPCDVERHRIITCVSLATQDDVFITLVGLVMGKEYLLNIDGYLHDFCDFNIEFGDQARGLPLSFSDNHSLTYNVVDSLIKLDWEISESFEPNVVGYDVYRRSSDEVKHHLIQQISHEKNAFGIPKLSYSITDTIHSKGKHHYKIVVNLSFGVPMILDEVDIEVDRIKKVVIPIIELMLDYKKKTPLTLLVFNAENNRLLKSRIFNFDESYKRTSINVHRWTQQGIHLFRFEVIDNNSKEKEVFYFKR